MNLSVEYESRIIDFTVEYRKRKTFSIEIRPPSNIKVISPKGIDENRVKQIVAAKGKWILQKLYEFKDIEDIPLKKEFINGESFIYLGRNYSLNIVVDRSLKKPNVKLYHGKFIIYTPVKDKKIMRGAMELWYRGKCIQKIKERIKYFKDKIGVEPRIVKVKEQKKRWGSCTSNKDIFFNWRCIMAPSYVIDYIVVHELCHLIHLNHSMKFWRLVEWILPDYKTRKKWLRDYGVRMDL